MNTSEDNLEAYFTFSFTLILGSIWTLYQKIAKLSPSQSKFNLNWLDWDSLITDNYHPHPPPHPPE